MKHHTPHRLADDEVRSVRGQLLSRQAELQDRLRRIQADLARKHEPLPRDADDAAIVVENDEVLQAIGENAAGELERIDEALHRLASSTFGICDECGRDIEMERLRAVPLADRCRGCAPDS